jgi:hypothetical protein
MSRAGTPSKDSRDGRRKSTSKGKGLSLMQMNNTFSTWGSQPAKSIKAVNICHPVEFNRTHIFGRDD